MKNVLKMRWEARFLHHILVAPNDMEVYVFCLTTSPKFGCKAKISGISDNVQVFYPSLILLSLFRCFASMFVGCCSLILQLNVLMEDALAIANVSDLRFHFTCMFVLFCFILFFVILFYFILFF